jgi:hypothetical protein
MRAGRGFSCFAHYRLCILLRAVGSPGPDVPHPIRTRAPYVKRVEPVMDSVAPLFWRSPNLAA